MNDFRAKLDSDQEISSMLYECRELMTDHLKHSLPNMMDEVDDVLLDIVVKTTNSQERTKYFNAMNEMRLKRHKIERECLENFTRLFNEKVRSDNTVECEKPKDIKAIMMSNIVNKVRNDCHLVLLNLDERMSKILNTGKANTITNPVSPEVVCTAFYNACELVDTGTEIRLIIFKYFEKYVTSMLNGVYSEIDNSILSMLRALSKTKSSDVNLINPEKIKALKMRVKSAYEISQAKKLELERLGTENVTIPVLDKLSNIRPFMEELLVDNHYIEGFKSDIDKS